MTKHKNLDFEVEIKDGPTNSCGGVWIRRDGERRLWGIENHDGVDYEDIPGYLFKALLRFHQQQVARG